MLSSCITFSGIKTNYILTTILCKNQAMGDTSHFSIWFFFPLNIFKTSRIQLKSYLNFSWTMCDVDIFWLLIWGKSAGKFSRHFLPQIYSTSRKQLTRHFFHSAFRLNLTYLYLKKANLTNTLIFISGVYVL